MLYRDGQQAVSALIATVKAISPCRASFPRGDVLQVGSPSERLRHSGD